MKNEGNITSPKVNNSTAIDIKYSEEEENLDKELKSMIRMISEMKRDIYKKMNELEDITNKQLKELKKNIING
jgi:hypothetical protein